MELVKTEIGFLPHDWEVCKLLDYTNLLTGLTYTPDNVKKNGLLVLRSSNIQNSRLSFDDNVYVDCNVDINKYLKKNDILICVRNGSANLIGKNAIAIKDYNATFGAFMSVLRGKDNDFIFQLFQKGDIQKRIKRNSSATINQITKSDFESILIPMPCPKERKEIVSILSNLDNLIDSIQELLDKKEKIKKSIMNTYFRITEKKSKKLLGDLLKFQYGDGNIIPDNGGKYPIYGANGIVGGFTEYNSEDEIVIGHIGTPGTVIWAEGKNFVTYNGTITTAINPNLIDLKYMYYLLLNYDIPSIAFGSSQPFLSYDKLKKVEVYIHDNINNQKMISGILTDVDNEILLLKEKMLKYKNIKSGMMEDLLTGKVRLKYE